MIKKEILKVIENMESEDTSVPRFGLELALKQASQSENSKPKGILTYEQCKPEANKFENSTLTVVSLMQHWSTLYKCCPFTALVKLCFNLQLYCIM